MDNERTASIRIGGDEMRYYLLQRQQRKSQDAMAVLENLGDKLMSLRM